MKKEKKKKFCFPMKVSAAVMVGLRFFFTFLLFTIGCTVKEISKLSLSSSTFMQQLEL